MKYKKKYQQIIVVYAGRAIFDVDLPVIGVMDRNQQAVVVVAVRKGTAIVLALIGSGNYDVP